MQLVLPLFYFLFDKVLSFSEAMDSVFEGFKTMIYALAIIIMSFVLKNLNDQLGLTNYIIESVSPWMSRELLPLIAFVALAGVTFATGFFLGSIRYFASDYYSTCSRIRG